MSAEAALARLAGAAWLADADLQHIWAVLDGPAGRTRAVGGLVRDTLLGRIGAKTDVDLATELTPDEVTARAGAAGIAAYPTGIEHGTVTLRAGALVAEVTTLREDLETDGRHAVVRFGRDWRRDAERRDFTMNALYANADGSLFDPLGGLDDCLEGRVQFIGEADRRIAEDRLRVFRFFRFSASHGGERLDAAGLEACARAVPDMGNISAERIGAEMVRMLGLAKVARTLGVMGEIGLLGMEIPAAELLAYETLCPHPSVAGRLALLGADAAELQAKWRLSGALVKAAGMTRAAAELIGRGELAEAMALCPEQAEDAAYVAAAQLDWSVEQVGAVVAQLAALPRVAFPIGGGDLIAAGMSPGKTMGAEIERLRQAWVQSGFSLSRDELLGMVGR